MSVTIICQEKREATAKARAERIGATLTRGENTAGVPVLLLTRWGWTREFRSLDEIEKMLDVMGAGMSGHSLPHLEVRP